MIVFVRETWLERAFLRSQDTVTRYQTQIQKKKVNEYTMIMVKNTSST